MRDAVQHAKANQNLTSKILSKLSAQIDSYILVTIHRAENTNDLQRLKIIVDAIKDISMDIDVIWPLHPRTKAVFDSANVLLNYSPKLYIVEPIGFLEMMKLEMSLCLIITDSGGVQKEACFHQIPCVTVRDETE